MPSLAFSQLDGMGDTTMDDAASSSSQTQTQTPEGMEPTTSPTRLTGHHHDDHHHHHSNIHSSSNDHSHLAHSNNDLIVRGSRLLVSDDEERKEGADGEPAQHQHHNHTNKNNNNSNSNHYTPPKQSRSSVTVTTSSCSSSNSSSNLPHVRRVQFGVKAEDAHHRAAATTTTTASAGHSATRLIGGASQGGGAGGTSSSLLVATNASSYSGGDCAAALAAAAPAQPTQLQWRKVLFERQPFEDNYVDPVQFLEELRENENVRNYKYVDVVKDTVVIGQQISLVVLFVCVFYFLLRGNLVAYDLVYLDVVLLLIACTLYGYRRLSSSNNCSISSSSSFKSASSSAREVANAKNILSCVVDSVRKVVSLGSALVLLTPILSTLTLTFSGDTITALSILTMSLNVLGADYSYMNGYTEKFSPNLSVNSATFGMILMASRMDSPLQSGALIAFGAFLFSLSPMARHHIRVYSFTAHLVVSVLLFIFAALSLMYIPVLAVLYTVCTLMITVVIPWWFVKLHSSVKYQINGPWDEAKPTNSAAAAEWANAGLLS